MIYLFIRINVQDSEGVLSNEVHEYVCIESDSITIAAIEQRLKLYGEMYKDGSSLEGWRQLRPEQVETISEIHGFKKLDMSMQKSDAIRLAIGHIFDMDCKNMDDWRLSVTDNEFSDSGLHGVWVDLADNWTLNLWISPDNFDKPMADLYPLVGEDKLPDLNSTTPINLGITAYEEMEFLNLIHFRNMSSIFPTNIDNDLNSGLWSKLDARHLALIEEKGHASLVSWLLDRYNCVSSNEERV